MLEREKILDLQIDNIKVCKFNSEIKALKGVGSEILKMGKFWAMYMTLCASMNLEFVNEITSG
jgi:hypothetical protein